MSVEEHREHAERLGAVPVAVLAVTDSRSEAEDISGKRIVDLVSEAGHLVVSYRVITNDAQALRQAVEQELAGEALVILTTGGTGISERDTTIETLSPLFDKTLPGFGELFRSLSYQEVGAAAMLSRAMLGVARGKAIALLPGSTTAVTLAVTRLLLPEMRHVVREARR